MSIMVRLDCEDMQCGAHKDVDVYERDMRDAPISCYVPDDWRIVRSDHDGIALALCPKHASPTMARDRVT